MSEHHEREADRIQAHFPVGPRVVIIGSTSFWHDDSEPTCTTLGRLLAGIADLVLITGVVEGVGETVGRSFFQTRLTSGQEPRVYHVLPHGEEAWDYAETLFAGADMTERREVLARLAGLYLAIEGGPGTVHEAAVARSRNAAVVPLGRSGGHAIDLYNAMTKPDWLDDPTWTLLGARGATPDEAAAALARAALAFLNR
jgi:hypothetical protein